MPYGFIGKASEKYLTAVGDALSSAATVHDQNPYMDCTNSAAAPPTLPSRENYSAKHNPDTAMSGGYITGVGNQTNVVVGKQEYDEILQKIRAVDASIAEELYNIALQIESLCQTVYIVPATLPKYLAIVDKVKASLGEFQSLTEDARLNAHQFIDEIEQIDRR